MHTFFTILLGFWICLGVSLVLVRLAPALGLMDIPGGRRQHAHPVALVGGLALIVSILARAIPQDFHSPISTLEHLAVLSMALLGLLDDRFDLRAKWKAALGLAIALLLAHTTAVDVAQAGHALSFLGVTLAPTSLAIPSLLLLMYWGLPHGFNLIDGANGLAMGFSLVVLGSLWMVGAPHLFFIGALLAVLSLNWPHAKLFMGDCGSLSIGLLLVLLAKHALILQAPSHILWLFAYPAVDVTLVVAIRLLQGRNLGIGDRTHLHFQLKDRWGLKFSTAPVLLSLAALCASEVYLPGAWQIIPFTGLFLLISLAVFLGARTLAESSPVPSALRSATRPKVGRSGAGLPARDEAEFLGSSES